MSVRIRWRRVTIRRVLIVKMNFVVAITATGGPYRRQQVCNGFMGIHRTSLWCHKRLGCI